eukprot:jgi/Mesen1/10138/ME000076S09646
MRWHISLYTCLTLKQLEFNKHLVSKSPHQDKQAVDRCHFVRQTKPVHVYCLAGHYHSIEVRPVSLPC